MLRILLNLLLEFLCTELLHLGYHFELDAAGHVVREQGCGIQYRTYKRDRASRVIRKTLPSGKFKEYEYDKCSQPCNTYYPRLRQGRGVDLQLQQSRLACRGVMWCIPHRAKLWQTRTYRIFTEQSWSSALSYERNAYGQLVCFRADEAETNASFTSEHHDSLGFELERLFPGGVSQSFVPLVLIQEGKAYSISVTNSAHPRRRMTRRARRCGIVVWIWTARSLRRLSLDWIPRATCRYRSPSKDSTTTTRRSWPTIDFDTTTLSRIDTSRRIRLAWWGIAMHAYVKGSLLEVNLFGLSARLYNKLEGSLHHIATNKNKREGKNGQIGSNPSSIKIN